MLLYFYFSKLFNYRKKSPGSKQLVTAVDTSVTQFVTRKIGNFTSAFVSEALQMVPEVTPIVAQAKNHEYTSLVVSTDVCTIPPAATVAANLNDWLRQQRYFQHS